MSKHGALYGLRSTKNYIVKVDGPNKDSAEVMTLESSETCVLQSSLGVDNYKSNEPKEKLTDEAENDPEEESTKELEKDPEEETTEEAEEDTEEPTDEAEEDTENDLEEEEEIIEEVDEYTEEEVTDEAEEDTDDEPTVEAEKDPEEEEEKEEEMTEEVEEDEEEMTDEVEEDTEEESIVEVEEEPDEEAIEDAEEGPKEESIKELEKEVTEEFLECGPLDADEHQSEYILYTSNEKKRSVDATIGELTPLQTYSRKKSRQESSKLASESGFGITDVGTTSVVSKAVINNDTSAQKEGTGSSGKRRRSRWDTQPEGDGEMGEGDRISKRRKTRWDVDDSQLKMLGPIHLANFMHKFLDESNWDLEIQQLKERLLELNSISEEEISAKLRNKLTRERQDVISRLIRKNPVFQTPPDYKPPKHTKKLYVPVKEYPEYNFIGLILGPRGNTQKRMEKETGAKIFLRGKGSSKTPLKKADPSDNEDLHVLIEADNQKSVDAAAEVVEKLLNPFNEEWSKHKVAQLRELSKLNGTYRDKNKCGVCGEEGHMHYACPSLQSTFNSHSTATCTLTAPNSNKEINDANLFVGYLPPAIDDNRLSELFSPFGKLTEAKVIKDRVTGLSKGYGFVKFENPTDAAAAIGHMNGLKIDGKMLAVRVAGRQPISGFSALSHLPVYPGPAVVSPAVPGQTTLPPPLMGHAVLSSVVPGQTSLQPSFMYLEQSCLLPQTESFDFSTPSSVSSLPGTLNAPSLSSSYNRSDRLQFLSPIPLPQFPGNVDYPGSQFQSYLATPAIRSSPSSVAQFPGDPDYPGSHFL